MNVWLDSIYQWFVENQENVLTFFSSTTFASIIAIIVAIVKNIKSVKQNTKSVNDVAGIMQSSQVIKDDVTNLTVLNQNLNEHVELCEKKVRDCVIAVEKMSTIVEKFDEELLTKFNAIIEVLTIVYSTIKDENIRTSVNSILIAAKHSDTASKAKLQEEVDELKAVVEQKNKELDEAVTKIVDKVAVDVTATSKEKIENTVKRY